MKVQLEVSRKGVMALLIVVILGVLIWVSAKNSNKISTWLSRTDKVVTNSLPQTGDELTNQEIRTISKSIVTLNCTDLLPGETISNFSIKGSGVYMGFPWSTKLKPVTNNELGDTQRIYNPTFEGQAIEGVITNAHVANTFYSPIWKGIRGECWIEFPDVNGYTSIRDLLKDNDLAVNSYNSDWVKKNENGYDYAILGLYIRRQHIIEPLKKRLLTEYNICDNVEVGDKVYIFGYPLAGFTPTEPELILGQTNIIVTDGLISGKAGNNYFTSAKIDAGNSGGLAVRKKDGAICLVGLPTWVAQGEYANLGVIQPMSSILADVK